MAPPAESDRRRRVPVEAGYGRRGNGRVFGASRPRDGGAWTGAGSERATANWADVLGEVEGWTPPGVARVIGIAGQLDGHRATEVLRVTLAHPRRAVLFQPT